MWQKYSAYRLKKSSHKQNWCCLNFRSCNAYQHMITLVTTCPERSEGSAHSTRFVICTIWPVAMALYQLSGVFLSSGLKSDVRIFFEPTALEAERFEIMMIQIHYNQKAHLRRRIHFISLSNFLVISLSHLPPYGL